MPSNRQPLKKKNIFIHPKHPSIITIENIAKNRNFLNYKIKMGLFILISLYLIIHAMNPSRKTKRK
jgi:hypothetical protein